MKTPNKICKLCQIPYRVKPYLLKTSKYCSLKCKAKDTTTEIKINCFICKKQFTHVSSRCNKAKYCSRPCYNIAQRNKGKKEFSCQHCGKKFMGHACHNRKFCSKQCVGKSYRETFKPKYTTVRKALIKRGLINNCNRCNYDQEPLILGVHHKDRNRNNNEISNLEILCPNCHSLEHLKHISHGFRE